MKKSVLVAFLFLILLLSSRASEIRPPFLDFFRKLIERPLPPKTPDKSIVTEDKIIKKIIPPLQMTIMGISGEVGNRVAIVSYKGGQRLLMEGDEQPGEYKIISIDEQKITLLHIQAERRQEITF
jgi:hypothetical protein